MSSKSIINLGLKKNVAEDETTVIWDPKGLSLGQQDTEM